LSPHSPSPIPHSLIQVSSSIIERMIQGNDRQLEMIDSLLEIHSCKEQGVVLNRDLVRFSRLLQPIIQDLQPMLSRNSANLTNLVPEDLPLVLADTTRLQRVLVNLFTYSLQHNPPGLNFTLKATVESGMIRTYIQDNGVVLSKQECDRLFDLHVRHPQTPCSTDIGLKMYLCRQIIQAHGGEIGVISNHKCGLTFWFTLPLATQHNY
ncbi:HAMP domain-containing histidine kinase, partial [Nostoc ellipsosporum NOK]|nr:HAMP domain-containing histidine kinase [Nostoc ellipsosporum NOK]